MKAKKQIGVWMDHSMAHLIEPKGEGFITATVRSEFTPTAKHSIGKNESLMHNKEQHLQSAYYHKLIEVLKQHNEILLFGPTTAKEELSNLLHKDHHFDKIKVDIKHADKMTDNQQHAFVKQHFHLA